MIRITQVGLYYVVDIGDNRIHMLNAKSLTWFLKHQVGFKKPFINAVLETFKHKAVVEIDMDKLAS